jgi:hypothetical protein
VNAQAPIARIVVANDKIADATLYAPGLPAGVHDLYCEPESTAHYLRSERLEHFVGMLDRGETFTDRERGEFADMLRAPERPAAACTCRPPQYTEYSATIYLPDPKCPTHGGIRNLMFVGERRPERSGPFFGDEP